MVSDAERIAAAWIMSGAAEPPQAVLHLMEDFALWTHERLGLPKCKTGLSFVETAAPCYREPERHSTLSDDDGLKMDWALTQARLAEGRAFAAWLFEQHFIHGWPLDDLARTRRTRQRIRRRKKQRLSPEDYQRFIFVRIKNILYGFLLDICRLLAEKVCHIAPENTENAAPELACFS